MQRQRLEQLKNKPMHGQFFRDLDKPSIDVVMSTAWLRSAGLKAETESLIVAAQDQALNTRYHQKNILKQRTDSKCRMCNKAEEHISHIVSGCSTLAPTEYVNRHNRVASFVHWTMCRDLGSQVCGKYYEHKPEKVVDINETTILWDVPVITDRNIAANRPDIIVHNRRERTCLLIDISNPGDANVCLKESEKLCKYKDLQIEISRMWNVKTRVVPVIVGALGTVKRGLKQNLQLLPGNPSAYEVQKITLLGSAHIIRKVLG